MTVRVTDGTSQATPAGEEEPEKQGGNGLDGLGEMIN